MNRLDIQSDFDAYFPGGELQAEVSWELDRDPAAVELRLVWNTSGKGDRDLKVVHAVRFDAPSARDRREVTITLPWGPYSFSGKLISLIWALELVVLPANLSVRKELTMGPDAREVLIGVARPSTAET